MRYDTNELFGRPIMRVRICFAAENAPDDEGFLATFGLNDVV